MIGIRRVNERENDWLLSWFETLIVTNWDMIDWEEEVYIIPVVELRVNPIGRDPDEIENDRWSPSTEGVRENVSLIDRTYEDWE